MSGTLRFRVFMAIGAVLAVCGATAWADPPSQVGRLSLISGWVSFHPGSLDEWAPATLNYPLTVGDHLWTDTGARAEVHVRSAVIRLNSNTEFSFLNLDDQTVQVRVSEGSVNVRLRRVDDGTVFEIDTPNATVTLPSAGSYRIDVQPSGETTVTVRAGMAEVTAGEDAYDVSAGQSTDISGSDSISYYVTAASRPDEWDAWSSSRDHREDQFASNPRVSRDMIGSEDLDDNGTWYNDGGNGPVWFPSHVPAGWAPYRFGHWSWVEPWGWTWVDDTSWGFAPFHYGRWAYQNARWEWSPGAVQARPVYAPALVVFVGGSGWTPAGDGIGWFPLGPREIYVPPYTVSPEYVQRINVAHVTNINVQIIENYNTTKVVYVNRTAPQAVTFVPREVFVQSRPAGRAVLSISPTEVSRAPVMGTTAKIAPQRESIIAQPVAARAPVPQPPPALLTRRVESRIAPTPARVPFAQQQKVLMANPGRPIEPVALTSMQRSQQIAPPAVRIVNPATLTKLKNPPVLKNVPPKVQQKPVEPAPVVPQPAIKPTPGVQPVVPQPAIKPTPKVQQKPVEAAPVVPQPAMKPAPGVQQKPKTPAPVGQAGSSAGSLITTLRTRTLPDADQSLSEARKVAGIRLDLNAVAQQLAAAKQALAGAEKDLAAGNSSQALQKATAIQKQVDDQMNQLAAAIQAAKQGPQKP